MAEEFTETYSMDILATLQEISNKLDKIVKKVTDLEETVDRIYRNQ